MSAGNGTRKIRVLCLHGWRTSGKILFMQTAAMRYHTEMEVNCVDAPWSADGPPDPMVAMVYKDTPYFQWYYRYDGEDGPQSVRLEGVEESLCFLVDIYNSTGPYDGIMGFSQGAAMTTILLQRLLNEHVNSPPKFAILIGGIPPISQYAPVVSLFLKICTMIIIDH